MLKFIFNNCTCWFLTVCNNLHLNMKCIDLYPQWNPLRGAAVVFHTFVMRWTNQMIMNYCMWHLIIWTNIVRKPYKLMLLFGDEVNVDEWLTSSEDRKCRSDSETVRVCVRCGMFQTVCECQIWAARSAETLRWSPSKVPVSALEELVCTEGFLKLHDSRRRASLWSWRHPLMLLWLYVYI